MRNTGADIRACLSLKFAPVEPESLSIKARRMRFSYSKGVMSNAEWGIFRLNFIISH